MIERFHCRVWLGIEGVPTSCARPDKGCPVSGCENLLPAPDSLRYLWKNEVRQGSAPTAPRKEHSGLNECTSGYLSIRYR
jgi:hypothetical protein